MSLERKKESERIPKKELWNHVIEIKKKSIQKKKKLYLLSREERGEVCEFIEEQLRKEYVRFSKLSQIAPIFFVRKKNSKKYIIQDSTL